MIYFDNAATTMPKPPSVIEGVSRAMNTFGNPSRGAHIPALSALRCLTQTRSEIADYFGLKNSLGVVFTPNATIALNLVISSIKGHIVTTAAEHNSVLRPVFRHGNYTIVPVNSSGDLDINRLKDAILPDTKAVIITHASNVTGNVYDIETVGKICKSKEIIFIVDAAQSAGLLPIQMDQMGITALCFSGHKSLYGPQGTGGICLQEEFQPDALFVGGSGSDSFSQIHPNSLPDALEAGTQNAHGIAGLQKGLEYVRQMNGDCYKISSSYADYFISKLLQLPNYILYGNINSGNRTPVVLTNLNGMDSGQLAHRLQSDYGIAVRAGAHCAPFMHRALGTEATGAVRFSFSHFNSFDEIDFAIHALNTISLHP